MRHLLILAVLLIPNVSVAGTATPARPATRPAPPAEPHEVAALRAEVQQLRAELDQLRKVLADLGVITLHPDGGAAPHDHSRALTPEQRRMQGAAATRPSVFRESPAK